MSVFQPRDAERPSVMVVVRPPGEPSAAPQRLTAVRYERPVAHLKHAGAFGQLVSSALAERGTPSRRGTVRIADLSSFRAVFVANSLGVAPVGQVDSQVLTTDPGFLRALTEAYDSVPWDRI